MSTLKYDTFARYLPTQGTYNVHSNSHTLCDVFSCVFLQIIDLNYIIIREYDI